VQVSQVTQTGKQAKQWRCGLGLTVALQLATPVTLDSNSSLYHIFWFIFHSVYPVRDTVRVRVSILGVRFQYT